MQALILANLIVFGASVLQAATGFGFAIMATPFLLLVFNSRDCIQMSIILSFFIAIVLVPKIRHEINHTLLKRLIGGSVFGVFIGLALFAYMSLDMLKLMVSIVTLVITSFLLVKLYQNHQKASTEDETEILPQSPEDKTSEKRNERLIGLASGALTTSVGMPGVPIALYFTAKNTKKEVVRSTTLAFFIFVYIASMVIQLITVKIGMSVWIDSMKLIPAAALGVFVGNILFNKINQKMFQLIASMILVYTGFYMLYKLIS